MADTQIYKEWADAGFPNQLDFARNHKHASTKQILEALAKHRDPISRKTKKAYEYRKITADSPGVYQMDLLDLSNYANRNNGYKFLLTVIDVYSRYAYVFPLKSKSPAEVLKHLKPEVLTQARTMTHDSGAEFKGEVKAYLANKNIKTYITEPDDHNKLGVINRFHRTLREKIKEAFLASKTLRYVDILEKIVLAYNTSTHRALNATPEDVLFGNEQGLDNKEKNRLSDLIGMRVRKLLKPQNFNSKKSTLQNYSDEVYEVTGISGNKVILSDNTQHPIYRVKIAKSEEPGIYNSQDNLRRNNLANRRLALEDII